MTHPLQQVFDQAIQQATKGKGERHGGDATPFLEQPWVHYGKMHGRGFLTGQAAKKLEEAASTREGDAFVQEALGAIVYMAMAILKEQERKEVVVPPAAYGTAVGTLRQGETSMNRNGERGGKEGEWV